jgi:hypothetical protein
MRPRIILCIALAALGCAGLARPASMPPRTLEEFYELNTRPGMTLAAEDQAGAGVLKQLQVPTVLALLKYELVEGSWPALDPADRARLITILEDPGLRLIYRDRQADPGFALVTGCQTIDGNTVYCYPEAWLNSSRESRGPYEIARIVLHELGHVYHERYNWLPRPLGSDEWFPDALAGMLSPANFTPERVAQLERLFAERERFLDEMSFERYLERQGLRGGGCTDLSLDPGSWVQMPGYHAPLAAAGSGLLLRGDAWTNGKLVNGRYDGNGAESAQRFDLAGGGNVYVKFSVDGGGQYLGVTARLFSGAGYSLLTTHHSWAGSMVVPDRAWLYGHLAVQPGGAYRWTVSGFGYDDGSDGVVITGHEGRLQSTEGRVQIRFGDNYGGTDASMLVDQVRVCLP